MIQKSDYTYTCREGSEEFCSISLDVYSSLRPLIRMMYVETLLHVLQDNITIQSSIDFFEFHSLSAQVCGETTDND